MRRTSGLRTHWPALLVGLLLAVLFIGALTVGTDGKLGQALAFTSAAAPTVITLAQYLYMRVDRWRLFMNRVRLQVLNPEMTVSYAVDYTINDVHQSWAAVSALLKGAEDATTRKLGQGDDGEVWLWHGTTVQVRLVDFSDPFEDRDILRIRVPAARASFRGMRKTIGEDMAGLLAGLERDVQASSRKYVVNVGFPGENPYFGVLVNNVSRDTVQRFDIDIFEASTSSNNQDRVRIHKEEVELVTTTALDAQLLALRYLSCEPVSGRA